MLLKNTASAVLGLLGRPTVFLTFIMLLPLVASWFHCNRSHAGEE